MSIDKQTPCNIILRMLLAEKKERNEHLLQALVELEKSLPVNQARTKVYKANYYLDQLMKAGPPSLQEFVAAFGTDVLVEHMKVEDYGRVLTLKDGPEQDPWKTGEVERRVATQLDKYIPISVLRSSEEEYSLWVKTSYPNFVDFKNIKNAKNNESHVVFIGGTCPTFEQDVELSIGCTVNGVTVSNRAPFVTDSCFKPYSTTSGREYWVRAYQLRLQNGDLIKTWVWNTKEKANLKNSTSYFAVDSYGLRAMVSDEYYRLLHHKKNPEVTGKSPTAELVKKQRHWGGDQVALTNG